MTPKEFKDEYDKLVEVYPSFFGIPLKQIAIAKYVQDLEPKWWSDLVNKIILSSNPRLDIEEAARGERLAKQKLRATQDILGAIDAISNNSTQAGLDNFLKSMGANSLLDAIEKHKKETT